MADPVDDEAADDHEHDEGDRSDGGEGPPWVEETAGAFELIGMRIENFGPIDKCFVPLDRDVTVLYGLNGAGKSFVIRALEAALSESPELPDATGTFKTPAVTVWLQNLDEPLPQFAKTERSNPWDPWQALWSGATAQLASELKSWEATVSTNELVQKAWRAGGAPFIQAVASENREEDDAPTEADNERYRTEGSRMKWAALWMTMALVNDIDEILGDNEILRDGFDSSRDDFPFSEDFADYLFALLSKNVKVTTRRHGRAVAVSAGHVRDEWDGERASIYQQVWPDVEPETVRRVIASDIGMTADSALDDDLSDIDDDLVNFIRSQRQMFLFDPSFRNKPNLEEFRRTLWAGDVDAVVAEVLGDDRHPVWARASLFESPHDPGPLPFKYLHESTKGHKSRQLHDLLETLEAETLAKGPASLADSSDDSLLIKRMQRLYTGLDEIGLRDGERVRSVEVIREDWPKLLRDVDGAVSVDARLSEVVDRWVDTANRILGSLLQAPPELTCEIQPIWEWSDGPIKWCATDESSATISLSELSAAEERWARFAIRLADTIGARDPLEQIIVVIDEPERALHRRGEFRLATALRDLATAWNLKLVVASHSPAFLSLPDAALLHVHRNTSGHTEVETLSLDAAERMEELGLNPSDLLQLYRALLLVEGQHEVTILEALLGDELRALGIGVLCMRGAKNLKAWDAQLIERFTDIPFFVLVDNDSSERVTNIWERAKQQAAEGLAFFRTIDELREGGKGSEGEFLRELCKNLITGEAAHRLHLIALTAADVPEYLPPAALAPAVGNKTWTELRSEAGEKASSSGTFKKWMTSTYGASYADSTLREAVASMDQVPAEIVAILNDIDRILSARRPDPPNGDLLERGD